MGGSLCCCGEGCCPNEPESTHRFRAHMRRDPDLPPEGQLYKGFFYLQEWQWPSVTSWDLIRAVHSTFSAIQEYMARDSLLKRLRRKTRDEDVAAQVQAEEQAEEKDSTKDLEVELSKKKKPPWKVKVPVWILIQGREKCVGSPLRLLLRSCLLLKRVAQQQLSPCSHPPPPHTPALCAQHPRLPEVLQQLPRLTVTLCFLVTVTNQIIPEVVVAHRKVKSSFFV
ncbi:PREDICTED: uncharacterized protein LOC108544758 [Rhinopithecus bieti]|uniref:uncharacterized protein LOC108544758 n=1 Tax=Rhinopithecus bieti TaxID=61621 RepID=UPI00083C5CD6|nr:PREDICTED: uncharacterized protein LOC108544758 [Rhinopithecus bieti]